jgi:hypothetical protein
MDWTQTLAIIATLIGAVFTFYRLTRDEITVIREDMRRIDERWEKMDAKWERLFERLLIQDQQKNSDTNKAT